MCTCVYIFHTEYYTHNPQATTTSRSVCVYMCMCVYMFHKHIPHPDLCVHVYVYACVCVYVCVKCSHKMPHTQFTNSSEFVCVYMRVYVFHTGCPPLMLAPPGSSASPQRHTYTHTLTQSKDAPHADLCVFICTCMCVSLYMFSHRAPTCRACSTVLLRQ